MARYGRFETVRDLFRGASATVSLAREAGSSGEPGFVVKAVESDQPGQDRAVLDELSGRLLGRASVLKKLTEAKAKRWARLVEAGKGDGGAFYVLERFPRTLDQIIAGRVRLDAAAMRHVIESILTGLKEIQKLAGQGHGELKPTNVMLDRIGKATSARIVLSDPLPAGTLDASAGEFEDIRAVGRIIYQLVYYQPYRELGGWPIADSAEWKRLGPKATAWRELANRLLDPAASIGSITIDQTLAKLPKAGGGGIAPKFGIAAAVVAVLAAGAYFGGPSLMKLFGGSNGPSDGPKSDPTAVRAAWSRWCHGYSFVRDFGGQVRARLDDMVDAKFLPTPLVEAMGNSRRRGDLDPSQAGSGSLAYDADDPPSSVLDGSLDELVMDRSGTVVEAVRSLGGTWPEERGIEALAQALRDVGLASAAEDVTRWSSPLGVLGAQDPAQWSGNAATIGRLIVSLYDSRDVRNQLVQTCREFGEIAGQLGSVGDPMLARLGGAGAALTLDLGDAPAESLSALQRELASLISSARDVRAFVANIWQGQVPEAFLDDTPELRAEGTVVTTKFLSDYLVAATYWNPPAPEEFDDPREGWRIDSQLTATEASVDDLESELSLSDAERAQFGSQFDSARRQIAAIRSDVDAVDSMTEADGAEAIRTRMREVDVALGAVGDSLGSLRTSVATARQAEAARLAAASQDLERVREARQAYVSQVSSVQSAWSTPNAAADAAWRAGRDANLAGLESGELSLDQTVNRNRELEAALRAVEAVTASRLSVPSWPNGVDRQAIESAAATRRDELIDALLRSGGYASGARSGAAPTRQSAEVAQYESWISRVPAVIAQAAAIRADAERCVPIDEGSGGVGSIEERFSAMVAEAEDLGIEEAVASTVATRLARLRLLGVTATELVQLAGDIQDLPRAMAAWRELGDAGVWPDTVADLDKELQLRDLLKSAVERRRSDLGEEAALGLQRELDGGSRSRWLAYTHRCRSAAQLSEAMGRQRQFAPEGVSASELSERTRYNVRLLAFVRAWQGLGGAPEDEAVKAQVTQFVQDAGAFSAELNADASDWIEKLRAAAAGGSGGGGANRGALEEVGPGAKGWELLDGVGVDQVTYRMAGTGREMTFIRLPDEAGTGESVFLAQSEVSIGLFSDVVSAAGAWGQMTPWTTLTERQRASSPGARRSGRLGAWRWQAQTGRIVPAQEWFDPGPIERGIAFYDPGVESGLRPPGDDSPMQQMTVAVAEAFCGLIGCGLPTQSQWLRGYGLAGQRGLGPTNLRDAVFVAQRDYAAGPFNSVPLPPNVSVRTPLFPDEPLEPTPWYEGSVSEIGRRESARPVPDSGNDGALWFVGVETGGTTGSFHHLVGNVAEFVALAGGGYAVVGGSALSPPEFGPPETPIVMMPLKAKGGRPVALFDVGVRPAFSATGLDAPVALADVLRPLVEQPAYVFESP
ncbi:MAG: hypothetical protein H6811_06320 [Phycisphaeraceae bacterium]|nr:hypothetical protein [Phycisphaeraceae bacterium]